MKNCHRLKLNKIQPLSGEEYNQPLSGKKHKRTVVWGELKQLFPLEKWKQELSGEQKQLFFEEMGENSLVRNKKRPFSYDE